MPPSKEMPKKITHDNGGNELFIRYKSGWNACHDQWFAYHKQELLQARIDEHKYILKLSGIIGSSRRIEELKQQLAEREKGE